MATPPRRNHPDLDGTSQLSPYLHFGQISVLSVALAVKNADAPAEDKKAFLEELIVRRELAVNFVRYNAAYDRFDACEPWADRTLREHLADRRKQVCSETQLEQAETHDPLWNAAQKQMMLTGWMHGYLRMYWAKKILEWSPSPAEAFDIAVRLNDRYELDGRDPMGMPGLPGRSSANTTAPRVPSVWFMARFAICPTKALLASSMRKAYMARITTLEQGRI
jgi:deoxyribodipyrimidine photo-lyase